MQDLYDPPSCVVWRWIVKESKLFYNARFCPVGTDYNGLWQPDTA